MRRYMKVVEEASVDIANEIGEELRKHLSQIAIRTVGRLEYSHGISFVLYVGSPDLSGEELYGLSQAERIEIRVFQGHIDKNVAKAIVEKVFKKHTLARTFKVTFSSEQE